MWCRRATCTDEATYAEAGQGGFEIRTLIAAAAAARRPGELQPYTAQRPIFAVGCTVARFGIDVDAVQQRPTGTIAAG